MIGIARVGIEIRRQQLSSGTLRVAMVYTVGRTGMSVPLARSRTHVQAVASISEAWPHNTWTAANREGSRLCMAIEAEARRG